MAKQHHDPDQGRAQQHADARQLPHVHVLREQKQERARQQAGQRLAQPFHNGPEGPLHMGGRRVEEQVLVVVLDRRQHAVIGEERPQSGHFAAHQEEHCEDREVGERQDQRHVAHPHPRHQTVEHEEADDQVEHAGRRIELAEQRRQFGLAAAFLKYDRVLILGQVGHQQGDEERAHKGDRVGRGAEHLGHHPRLIAHAVTPFVQIRVAVGDPAPAATQHQRHRRRGEREAGPDQHEAVHGQDVRQQADDQGSQRGSQSAEGREQREQTLGVLDVEVAVGEIPEQRIEADVPDGQVQLQRIVETRVPGRGKAEFHQAPQQGAAEDQQAERHLHHPVDGEPDQQVREHGRVDQHHHRREQEDHRQLVGAHVGEKGRVTGGETHAHPGLEEEAEHPELEKFRPFSRLDLEKPARKPPHPHPRSVLVNGLSVIPL